MRARLQPIAPTSNPSDAAATAAGAGPSLDAPAASTAHRTTASNPIAAATAKKGKNGRNSLTPPYFGTFGSATAPMATTAFRTIIASASRSADGAFGPRRLPAATARPAKPSARIGTGVVIAVMTNGACHGAKGTK